jgi:hypothetical protein
MDGDVAGALEDLGAGTQLSIETRSLGGRAMIPFLHVGALGQSGHLARTTAAAGDVLGFYERTAIRSTAYWVRYFVAWCGVATGELDESPRVLRRIAAEADPRLQVSARIVLSMAMIELGELEDAFDLSVHAFKDAVFPSNRSAALAARAMVELRRGRSEAALALAEAASLETSRAAASHTRSCVHLVRAEALHALGRDAEALRAIADARDAILRSAEALRDPELRSAFLEQVRVNARTLELASAWLGETADGELP